MPIHLVWFRADLRIHDNLALASVTSVRLGYYVDHSAARLQGNSLI
jgi:deoxyribodipyrimidine photolyase